MQCWDDAEETPELYNEEAELNAAYCDRCGTVHCGCGDDSEPAGSFDGADDEQALASAGFGMDESYGGDNIDASDWNE